MRNSPVRLPFGAVLSRRNAVRTWMRSPASRQSRYALDCLNFLIGSVQTGLGTFVAFYLASLGWSKESVGFGARDRPSSGCAWTNSRRRYHRRHCLESDAGYQSFAAELVWPPGWIHTMTGSLLFAYLNGTNTFK